MAKIPLVPASSRDPLYTRYSFNDWKQAQTLGFKATETGIMASMNQRSDVINYLRSKESTQRNVLNNASHIKTIEMPREVAIPKIEEPKKIEKNKPVMPSLNEKAYPRFLKPRLQAINNNLNYRTNENISNPFWKASNEYVGSIGDNKEMKPKPSPKSKAKRNSSLRKTRNDITFFVEGMKTKPKKKDIKEDNFFEISNSSWKSTSERRQDEIKIEEVKETNEVQLETKNTLETRKIEKENDHKLTSETEELIVKEGNKIKENDVKAKNKNKEENKNSEIKAEKNTKTRKRVIYFTWLMPVLCCCCCLLFLLIAAGAIIGGLIGGGVIEKKGNSDNFLPGNTTTTTTTTSKIVSVKNYFIKSARNAKLSLRFFI